MARATATVLLLLLFCAYTICLGSSGDAGSDAECRTVYLMVLRNHSDGIHISLLSSSSPRPGVSDPQTPRARSSVILESTTISQRYLSSECGSHYFRCDDLLVVATHSNNEVSQYVIFVPLVDGILLIQLNRNGSDLSIANYHIIEVDIGCSPSKLLKINDYIFSICLNLEARYLSVLQLYLDPDSLKNTKISTILMFSGLENPSTVSNFQFIPLGNDPNSQFVYFSTGRYLYGITPLSYTINEFGEFQECRFAESLIYAGDETLIAYCYNKSSVYFSLASEQEFSQTFYSTHGQPFVCPNHNVFLSVFSSASYIQFGLQSDNSRVNVNIPGMSFDSGICYGTQSSGTLFAFYDAENGVYALHLATSVFTRLSSKGCLQDSCEPLKVFEDRYVVIREREANDANVIVVDSWKNFSKIIDGQHLPADLLTLITVDQGCATQTTESTVLTEDNTSTHKSQSTAMLAIYITLPIGIIFIIMLIILTVFLLRWRKKLCFSPPKPAVKVSDNSNTLRDTELLLHPKPASGGQPPEYIKVLKPNNCDVPSDCILPSHNHVYEDKPTHTEETAADLERTEGEPDAPQTDHVLPKNQPSSEPEELNSDRNQGTEARSNHPDISAFLVQNGPCPRQAHEDIELDTLPPRNASADTGATTQGHATPHEEREHDGYMPATQESDYSGDTKDTDLLLPATPIE